MCYYFSNRPLLNLSAKLRHFPWVEKLGISLNKKSEGPLRHSDVSALGEIAFGCIASGKSADQSTGTLKRWQNKAQCCECQKNHQITQMDQGGTKANESLRKS